MKKYLKIARISIMKYSYYLSQSIMGIGTSFIGVVMMQFFWKALYNGTSVVNGTTLQQMCVYSAMSWILNLFQCENLQYEIVDKVKTGDIILEFLLPYNYIFGVISKAIGENVWIFLVKALPILLGIVLLLRDTFLFTLDFSTISIFVISAILGNILLLLINCILALMSFSFIEISGLFVLKEILITIFAGLIIPTWFFPDVLQKAVIFLPFQYMIQAPLAFLCGKIDVSEMGITLFIQIFWIFLSIIVTFLMWKINTKELESFGG